MSFRIKFLLDLKKTIYEILVYKLLKSGNGTKISDKK